MNNFDQNKRVVIHHEGPIALFDFSCVLNSICVGFDSL